MKKYILLALISISTMALADELVNGEKITGCGPLAEQTVNEKASAVKITYSKDKESEALTCHAALLTLNSGMNIQMLPQDGEGNFKIVILDRYSKWMFWK